MINSENMEFCECKEIRKSKSFSGWADFDEFLATLKKISILTEIPVKKTHLNVGLTENWYKCRKCERIWLLVEPDPPFNGLWKPIT